MKRVFENKKGSFGFTLVELLIAMTIVATLFGFTTINLMQAHRTTITTTAAETLIADLKRQQIKAINGSSAGEARFGAFFEGDKYTLFQGSSFTPGNPTNFSVNLGGNVLSSTFPNNTIVFLPLSGEIDNFSETANTINLTTISGGNQQTITVNRYGVIVSVQ